MSDVPPNLPKSPIVIIVLLAVIGAAAESPKAVRVSVLSLDDCRGVPNSRWL